MRKIGLAVGLALLTGVAQVGIAQLGVAHAGDLPAAIAKRGAIIAAIVPNYPPIDMRDPATNALTGLDVDLGNALAAKLGVKMKWQETSFDQMLAAVDTGRVDIILSGMSDLASRHNAASFVDYMKSGPQFYILAANKAKYPNLLAICGHTVGASRRTSFVKEIAAWSVAHCTPASRKPIKVIGTEGSADARLQLEQGRVDAAMQGSETLPYVMGKEPGKYAPLGKPISSQLTGIGVSKKDTQLQTALAGALQQMVADGTYGKILAKWHLSGDAIDKVTINAGK